MKQLIIFIGHPAGGKTTVAKKLAERLGDSKVIEVDEIKKKISGSVFGKDDAEREKWFQETNRQILNSLNAYDYVLVDEGFFEQKYLDKIIAGVNSEIKKVIAEITFSLGEHIKRNKKRNDPSEPVERMYKIWNEVSEESRIKPDIEIHNPDLSVEQTADLILTELNSLD